jgi:hypothetical protein
MARFRPHRLAGAQRTISGLEAIFAWLSAMVANWLQQRRGPCHSLDFVSRSFPLTLDYREVVPKYAVSEDFTGCQIKETGHRGSAVIASFEALRCILPGVICEKVSKLDDDAIGLLGAADASKLLLPAAFFAHLIEELHATFVVLVSDFEDDG